jgi:hypothetical protein
MAETQIDPAAEPQTPAREGGPVGDVMDVDGLIAKHFGEDFLTEGEDPVVPPTPADPEPQPEAEDTPAAQQDPDVEDLDTEVEPEGGAEAGAEPEDEETEETPVPEETPEDPEVEALLEATEDEVEPEDLLGDLDTPEEESFLPEFDRVKFLKENPELEAPYKHMQAAFTRKTKELAAIRQEAQKDKAEAEAMQQQYDAFQEMLKDPESFRDFLVEVSLNRPEVMEQAYEEALALNEDEGRKEKYQREKDLQKREKALKKKEEQEALARRQQRTGEIIDLTKRVASKLGLTGEGDLQVAEQFVANKILSNVANGGERDLSNEELVVAVRRASKALEQQKSRVRRSAKAEQKRESLKAAQDRVKQPRRPSAPKPGSPTRSPKLPERKVKAPQQDPLGSFIDEQLGVDTAL